MPEEPGSGAISTDPTPSPADVVLDCAPDQRSLTLEAAPEVLPSGAELVARAAVLGSTLGVMALVHTAEVAHTAGSLLALAVGLAAAVVPWPGGATGPVTLSLQGPQVVVRAARRRGRRARVLPAQGLRWRVEEATSPWSADTRTLAMWGAGEGIVLRRLRGTRAELEGAMRALVAPAEEDPRVGLGEAEVPAALRALRQRAGA